MIGPLKISFRNFPHSDALEAVIVQKAEKLEQIYDRIVNCQVVVEQPHRTHNQGRLFHVRLFIAVPGQEIVVGRDPADEKSHVDPYLAVRDAFRTARRRLQDYVRQMPRQSRQVQARPPHARVIRLIYEEPGGNFGFLETPDGRELYFHHNSVISGRFDELEVGMEVRFDEEQGEEGPQATTVEPIGKEARHQFPSGMRRRSA